MGAAKGSSVTIRGSADVLQQLGVGRLEGTSEFSVSGELALRYVGSRGPILVDLFRLNRFFGLFSAAASPVGGMQVEPFIRLDRDLSVQDDT